VPDNWHRLKNRKVGGSIPSLPTRLPRSAAYAMRLPAGQSPGLRHRRTPGHASSHGEEPDDGSYRSSGQVLITRAAAAVARRRDPTNPAPAQPPGAGGAGAGGTPQDWGQGARSRDTVRPRAPWPPLGKRSLIERSASSYPKRTEPESTEVFWRSALFPQLGSPLAVGGRRMQKGHGLTSRNGPPTRTQEQPG
jgi:hypothetical protein